MEAVTKLMGVLLFVILLIAILVGGYLGGWWLREDRVQRTAEIDETTFARQTALQNEVLDLNRDIRNIDVQLNTATEQQRPALVAQRQATVNRFCDAHGRMTGSVTIPDNVAATASQECY